MFVVVPEGHESLLGDKACERLGLVKRMYHINENAPDSVDSIEGLVSYHSPLRDKLKQELDRMTSLEVIKKVEEPTEWANSI